MAAPAGLTLAAHLARRWFGSLARGGPSAADEEWVTSVLKPGEVALWDRMGGPDRRHAVAVGRRVAQSLASQPGTLLAGGPAHCSAGATEWAPHCSAGATERAISPRAVLAAALLHDVGKVEAGLGIAGRVVATLVGLVGGRRAAVAWVARSGRLGRVGRYLCYPRLGAGLLEAAGSDPLTVDWASQHHLPPDRCQLPPLLAGVLRAADQG